MRARLSQEMDAPQRSSTRLRQKMDALQHSSTLPQSLPDDRGDHGAFLVATHRMRSLSYDI